ncbi:hypothetical protein GGI07_003097 [Coemansia sp. Benny D115]|nr:hypothetical protein GGI07_003097 [Coemansia sp. Benny D115]
MALGGRTVCLRRELLPIAIRQYVPADAQLRSEPGPGTEEYELESRVVANTEVMFETPADGHGGDNGHHRPDAAVATDDWGIDNWGEEDEEDEREQENSPPKTVPSRSATPATSAATAHASTPAGNSTNNSTNNSNSNSKGSKKD